MTAAVLAGSQSFDTLADGGEDGGRIRPGDWTAYTDKPLVPFQTKFLADCLPGRKRIVGLTMGRGGGKTFLAGLVAAEELVVYGGDYLLSSVFVPTSASSVRRYLSGVIVSVSSGSIRRPLPGERLFE